MGRRRVPAPYWRRTRLVDRGWAIGGVRFRRAAGFRGPSTAPEFQSAKGMPHARVRRRPQSLRADRWQILSGPGGEIVRRRSAVSAQGCHADKVRTPTSNYQVTQNTYKTIPRWKH